MQICICMYIEHTFKILKEKWRIIMTSDDVLLRHMIHIVTACIILHNMYKTRNNKFNREWIDKMVFERRTWNEGWDDIYSWSKRYH